MSTDYASLEDLITDEVSDNTAEVTLPNGKKLLVRGMSRHELQQIGKGTEDPSIVEARMLVYCIVKPALTEAQVTQMQRAKGPNFLKDVTGRIRDLSGLAEGAAKSDVD